MYLNEADFAKTIEMANTRFLGRVASFQLNFNEQITELYRRIAKYSTSLPEDVIDKMEFSFAAPKYHNGSVTNDLLSNHTAVQDFLVQMFFGQDGVDDPKNAEAIKIFKKNLAVDRLPMIPFKEYEKMFKDSLLEGTGKNLDPNNKTEEEG